ncbi:DUF3592 domain-containing protein (plasmid) [Vibrio campbellii]|uniref:DUF3592 domain-containing protein n=2 Tax=Vibrio campbellii TaxID=680 RepID=A0ABY5IKH2_9VIBR|nr:DUF3592 domain-containing protein [Vibrio campbellii]UTZ34808.1 DUF3592 domain-containing protein [Vibrio campbellii]
MSLIGRVKNFLLLSFISLLYIIVFFVASIALKLETEKVMKVTSTEWIISRGVVQSTEIKENRTSKGVSWCPKVHYKYKINKDEYISDTIHLVKGCSFTKHSAKAKIKAYKVGDAIDVYIDPNDFEISALNVDMTIYDYWQVILFSIIILLLILQAYLVIKFRKRK